MQMKPLVKVIVPCYEYADYLPAWSTAFWPEASGSGS